MIQSVDNAQDATNIDFKEKVYVYFNFTKKLWSVLQGKVKAHCDYICLRDVTFQVSERGRQRVIRNGRKNVHAFIVGYIVMDPASVPYSVETPWDKVTYNPFHDETFMRCDKYPVREAQFVDMSASSEVAKVIAKL